MSDSPNNTVLAWLQKELSIYAELLLISPIRDLSFDYWHGKPTLCLAHHFFPASIPNFLQQLNHPPDCYQLFQDQLGITQQEDWADYLQQIQEAVDRKREEDALRDLHIGSVGTSAEAEFEKYATSILMPLNKLFHQLVELSIREELSTTTRSPSPRIHEEVMIAAVEPLKSRWTDDTVSLSSSTTSLTLEEIESSLTVIEQKDLIDFHHWADKLPYHPDLAVRISAIDATHAALHLQLHKGDLLRTTIQFINTAAYIRNELEFIQAKMLKTTTTDVGIQDLESRAELAGASINHMSQRFQQLMSSDTATAQEFQFLQDKYRLICSWVDDVRVWFVEAERIRSWIEQRIQVLESMPALNSLEEVELDYEMDQIHTLNNQQEQLEQQVQVFDKEDMTRLRAHVKALTGSERRKKDLSPADTTTIEITFTTLMTLDRLMHLLRRHAYELQMLTLRMYWEQEYHTSVTWVRATGEQVRGFVQHTARWRPPPLVLASHDVVVYTTADIIAALIEFEKQSAAFDQGQFTVTVNMYQDLDDACNIELPGHLESRQVALEEAFEELTHRIAFARQVVEQYLVVADFLGRADKLKQEGQELKQDMTIAAEQHHHTQNTNEFTDKVSLFQENALRLVTGVASRVPYPEATHPTDQQGNEDANQVIRMVIGARKSALVLFGETLDQSLSNYRRALQLQKRGKQLQDEITRLSGWVDERMRSIKKSKVDVFVGKCALDEVDLARLKKERDGQVSKLKGIKENEINRLQENIKALQVSSSQPPTNPNTVALVTALHASMATLNDQLAVLQEALQVHSLCLDILGKRIAWETQHSKASLWVSNTTFQIWEFVSRKAQWRPDMEAVETSALNQEFDVMQRKVQEFRTEQLDPVDQTFNDLVDGFSNILLNSSFGFDQDQPQDNITNEHVQRRQDTLMQSFNNLNDLIDFSSQVILQHYALTAFSSQVTLLTETGRSLMSDIQQANQAVMKMTDVDTQRQVFVEAVKEMSQKVVQLWMQHGAQLPYPQCPEDARATRPSTSDDEISTEVATVVFKTYTELQELVKRLSELLQRLDISIVYRLQLEQWCADAEELTHEVETLASAVQSACVFDMFTASVVDHDSAQVTSHVYLEKAAYFTAQLDKIKLSKYDDLEAHLDQLKQELSTEECDSVDPSIAEPCLKQLETSWQALTDAVQLFSSQANCCVLRSTWKSLWTEQDNTLSTIQDNVREWTHEKSVWSGSTCQRDSRALDSLVDRMQSYSALMEEHQLKLSPLKSAYTDMTVAYKSLQNTSEFVDHTLSVETEQEDLEKLSAKLQDSVTAQLAEIHLIKSRHDWETAVDNQLKLCAEHSQETESFIRNDARWSPSAESVDAQPIQDASVAQLAYLSALLNSLDQLQQQKHTLLQTEDIFRKKAALESSIERVKSHVDFLDQVLEQRASIVSSLFQVAELEALAESIKAKFLSDTVQDGQQALLDYSSRVAQLSATVSHVMVYPVRHYRDHDTACREQDIAHNTIMSEMMSARKSRLDELGHSLEAILKSKERLSRCKAAEESYMSEARVVKEWIEAKTKQVQEVDPEELRLAVHAMDAIQAATISYTSSVQGLKDSAAQCLTMIQQQGQDDDGISARIRSTQSSMVASWDDLLSSVESRKGQLSTALRRAEYNQCVSSFHQECDTVRQKVSGVDLALVTEQVTTEWQQDVRALESNYIEQIKSRLTEEKIKLSQDGIINNMTDMLSKVTSDFEALKQMISDRTTKANNHRFKSEYFSGADALEACMQKTRLKLDALKSSACIVYGQDAAADQLTVQTVTESYQFIVDQFENQHHEKYDEQRSFYRFLQLNKVADLDAVDTRQQALEKSWKHLKADVAHDKQYVDVVSQWFDLHAKLNEMQLEALSSIFARLDQMVMDATMPTFLEQDAALLKLLESRLSACYDIAASLNDDGNLKCYQHHHDILQKDLVKAAALLAEKREMAQKHVDFTSCQQAIQDVQQSVDQVVKAVDQRLQSVVIQDGSIKHLEQLYRNLSSGVANTESVEKKLSIHLESIETNLLSSLQSKHANDDRLTAMKSDVVSCAVLLQTSLKTEQSVNDMLRRVLGQAKSTENITTWIENCNTATNQVLGDQMDEGEAALEIASLSQKLIDFENVIDSFKDLSSNLMAMSAEEHPLLKQLMDIVENNASMINGKWQETQDQLKNVESIVEKTTKGVAIARKIKHITAIVGEAREYVTSVKLFDSDNVSIHTQDFSEEEDEDKTAVGEDLSPDDFEAKRQPLLSMLRESEVKEIQRSLQALQADVKPQIELEMKELSSMMTEVDNTFVRQHQEVQESVDSLYDLLRIKNVELEKAMDIGKYLTIADDIEILQSSLEEAVSKSTPHHTALIGNGFNRIDLQAKLIELDARFKYYEKKIVQNLASAKEQATLLIDKRDSESSLVEIHLKSMQVKWDLIKKQFKTRKIELSRTIDTSMDSKDQHARIRKSSLPTRKASSLLRDRADLSISKISPSSSSTASSSTSSSTKSSNNRINPGRSTSRYLTPPLQHQPSKSASHLKPKTHRSTIKPPLNSYVADPDNDLDIEIGRIVNETPYRVKVKMVPGEVGRYWFGNLNPKLAYCRVLKSKMVMVRVGGGWTELSQFLRDHALLEGDFIPRSQRRNKMILEEEEPKSPTIQEGFIETRRDLSNRPPNQPQQHRSSTTTNSSGSRSNTTSSYPSGSPSHSASTSGYKEGDKFITLDQHGNQLEVKMRKANDFTKRRIARRKEKPVHNT